MIGELLSEYTERYGEPILRFKPDRSRLTKLQVAFGEIPYECCVFKIDHISEVMVVVRFSDVDEWHVNFGERAVIKELLGRNSKEKAEALKPSHKSQSTPCCKECGNPLDMCSSCYSDVNPM